ncbi:MAG: hypothetical protein ACK4OO_06180 [bacterium]
MTMFLEMENLTRRGRTDIREEGWTFIEAILAVVIMSIMILGLTITLLAFKEHLDRSWAIRVMDQYGNDVVENLAHELRNAVDVTVRSGTGNSHRIDIRYLDPYYHNRFTTTTWYADMRNSRIMAGTPPRPIDPLFPPVRLKRGEKFVIEEFTLNPYGSNTPNRWEERDALVRKREFRDATWDIKLRLRYERQAVYPNERNWFFTKEYKQRVYLKNKNLVVKRGVTGEE